jgi:hypothetical protein
MSDKNKIVYKQIGKIHILKYEDKKLYLEAISSMNEFLKSQGLLPSATNSYSAASSSDSNIVS